MVDEKQTCRTCDGRGTEPVMTYHPGDEGQTGSSVSMQQVGQATMSGGRETPIFHATRGGTPTFTGSKMQGIFTRSEPKIPGSNLPPSPDEPCSECGTPVERSFMDTMYDTVPLCENCMNNHLAEREGKPTNTPTLDDPNWQEQIERSNPMDIAWRVLKHGDR